jgi:hypothetical protein
LKGRAKITSTLRVEHSCLNDFWGKAVGRNPFALIKRQGTSAYLRALLTRVHIDQSERYNTGSLRLSWCEKNTSRPPKISLYALLM